MCIANAKTKRFLVYSKKMKNEKRQKKERGENKFQAEILL